MNKSRQNSLQNPEKTQLPKLLKSGDKLRYRVVLPNKSGINHLPITSFFHSLEKIERVKKILTKKYPYCKVERQIFLA